jgi:pyruvate formate lyase activating enzyme
MTARRAEHWEARPGGDVLCRLCPQRCRIAIGGRGTCRARVNEGGTLLAATWGKVAALHVDPIEKKPLYHFHPGSTILSVGTRGCSLACAFCQNWQLVDGLGKADDLAPDALVDAVDLARERSGSIGLAYTYNEPLIGFEYLKDTAPLLRAKGYKIVLVTNGFLEAGPFEELLPLVDAMNIDLKAIDDSFYVDLCGGRVAPVTRNIARAAKSCHVEVTNLLVPGRNTDEDQVRRLVDFVASVDPALPLHFSRYFPNRDFTAPPTPAADLRRAYEIARERLKYVYLGNVAPGPESNTACAVCGATLIERAGYRVRVVGLDGTRCRACGAESGIVV